MSGGIYCFDMSYKCPLKRTLIVWTVLQPGGEKGGFHSFVCKVQKLEGRKERKKERKERRFLSLSFFFYPFFPRDRFCWRLKNGNLFIPTLLLLLQFSKKKKKKKKKKIFLSFLFFCRMLATAFRLDLLSICFFLSGEKSFSFLLSACTK